MEGIGTAALYAAIGLIGVFVLWHVVRLALLAGQKARLGRPVDFRMLALHWKPNQFLLAPPGTTTAQPHAEPPVLPMPPEKLRDALAEVMASEPRTTVLHRSPDGFVFTAVQATNLMRFPDFVSVEIRSVPGGSTLLVYSRSVYGIRDFGVNRARIERWLTQVKARLG